MKQGSIAVMKKPLLQRDINFILGSGVKEWPEPSDDIPLEITDIIPTDKLVSGHAVALDLYPELQRHKIYLDINLFEEVQPPMVLNIPGITQIGNA